MHLDSFACEGLSPIEYLTILNCLIRNNTIRRYRKVEFQIAQTPCEHVQKKPDIK